MSSASSTSVSMWYNQKQIYQYDISVTYDWPFVFDGVTLPGLRKSYLTNPTRTRNVIGPSRNYGLINESRSHVTNLISISRACVTARFLPIRPSLFRIPLFLLFLSITHTQTHGQPSPSIACSVPHVFINSIIYESINFLPFRVRRYTFN